MIHWAKHKRLWIHTIAKRLWVYKSSISPQGVCAKYASESGVTKRASRLPQLVYWLQEYLEDAKGASAVTTYMSPPTEANALPIFQSQCSSSFLDPTQEILRRLWGTVYLEIWCGLVHFGIWSHRARIIQIIVKSPLWSRQTQQTIKLMKASNRFLCSTLDISLLSYWDCCQIFFLSRLGQSLLKSENLLLMNVIK